MTLDADTEVLVRRLMERCGISFSQALNEAIRAGSGGSEAETAAPTTVHRMGMPTVALDKALQLGGELEDEEIVRRMRTGR